MSVRSKPPRPEPKARAGGIGEIALYCRNPPGSVAVLAPATQLAAPAALDVLTRPATEAELRWVRATWSRCMRASTAAGPGGSKFVALGHRKDGLQIDARLLSRAHHGLVDSLLPYCSVRVAYLADLPDEPVGWAAFEDRTLHFVFVVPFSRRAGVARALIAPLGCSALSHITPDAWPLLRYLNGENA